VVRNRLLLRGDLRMKNPYEIRACKGCNPPSINPRNQPSRVGNRTPLAALAPPDFDVSTNAPIRACQFPARRRSSHEFARSRTRLEGSGRRLAHGRSRRKRRPSSSTPPPPRPCRLGWSQCRKSMAETYGMHACDQGEHTMIVQQLEGLNVMERACSTLLAEPEDPCPPPAPPYPMHHSRKSSRICWRSTRDARLLVPSPPQKRQSPGERAFRTVGRDGGC
jgi:hypothetical protein